MQVSIQSGTIPTQSSSSKSYFVKRKALQNKQTKEAKDFFRSPEYKEQQFETLNKNSSVKSITMEDSIIMSKNEININRFSTINPSNAAKSSSDLISLAQSQVQNPFINNNNSLLSRLNSVSSLTNSINKRRPQRKYVFETICDQSFNKSLVKKEILIEDPQTSNPQNFSYLPQITKNTGSNYKIALLESRMSRSGITKNDIKLLQNEPLHILQKDIADKFSMQKLKDYRKIWMRKEKSRKQINQNCRISSKTPSLVFNASLLQKSANKSRIITSKHNHAAELRKQKCCWEDQLRGKKQKYLTIGEVSNTIQGLKGKGQNLNFNIEVRPTYLGNIRNFSCEEVYKSHKTNNKLS